MLRAGMIKPSALKKQGRAQRFCVNYCKFIHITVADTYPLPRIDELLHELSPSDTFTHDARKVYWSIDIHPLFQLCHSFGFNTVRK